MYTSIKKFLRACFEFSNIIGSGNSYDRFDPGTAYHCISLFNLIFLLLFFLDSVILEVILRYHFL